MSLCRPKTARKLPRQTKMTIMKRAKPSFQQREVEATVEDEVNAVNINEEDIGETVNEEDTGETVKEETAVLKKNIEEVTEEDAAAGARMVIPRTKVRIVMRKVPEIEGTESSEVVVAAAVAEEEAEVALPVVAMITQ